MVNRLLLWLSQWLRVRVICIEGMPYLERYWVGAAFGVTVYLHRFLRPDEERWLHDHPWRWSAGLVLSGGYVEERLSHWDPAVGYCVAIREVRPGRLNVLGAGAFHRVAHVRPGTWTLFVTGRRCKGWGFLSRGLSISHGRALTYTQPYDVERSADWQHSAPRARDVRLSA